MAKKEKQQRSKPAPAPRKLNVNDEKSNAANPLPARPVSLPKPKPARKRHESYWVNFSGACIDFRRLGLPMMPRNKRTVIFDITKAQRLKLVEHACREVK